MATELEQNRRRIASGLSVLASAQGFTLWHYNCRDEPLSAAFVPGYFTPIGSMLHEGDMVFVSSKQGSTLGCIVQISGEIVLSRLVEAP